MAEEKDIVVRLREEAFVQADTSAGRFRKALCQEAADLIEVQRTQIQEQTERVATAMQLKFGPYVADSICALPSTQPGEKK